MNTAPRVLIDGMETERLDSANRGLHYGDGVFTTLLVKRGIPLFLDSHLARLQRDSAALGLPFPSHALLRAEALRLAAGQGEQVLKIILTSGSGGRGYRRPDPAQGTRILSLHPCPAYPPEWPELGVQARWGRLRLGINPALAGVKHLNRLEQVLARAEWSDPEIYESLLLDCEGNLVEGVMSNVFLVKDGALQTPLLDRCGVAGVMRAHIIAWAQAENIPVRIGRILPQALLAADEVFFSNAVIGAWPLRRLESHAYQPGGVTLRLRAWLLARMEQESQACPVS
jgi:4-amino-4-deoxychorismate lyase